MTGDEPARPAATARLAQFRVQDAVRPRAGTQTTTTPAAAGHTLVDELTEDIGVADSAAVPEPVAPPELDGRVIADAPVADPAATASAATTESPDTAPIRAMPAAPPAEPEVEFGQEDKPAKEPEVKTVKVRSSVDVMAELEALRKKATSTTPKAPKRDILADLESLRPRREFHRTVHLQVPQDILPRAKSVRVTLAFEDGEQTVIESRDQQVDLGDASDVRSLSVNLKIDLA
jgi:hypothetical protein